MLFRPLMVYADEGRGWIRGEVWPEPGTQHRKRKISNEGIILSTQKEPGIGLLLLVITHTFISLFTH